MSHLPPSNNEPSDPWKDDPRAYTFDMEDGPEQEKLAKFPLLDGALTTLNDGLKKAYQEADAKAVENQKTHRFVAHFAIATGAIALVLAIIQPALKEEWGTVAKWLEFAVVIAGTMGVVMGLIARFDNQWFVQRHRSERLRMLKFTALAHPELWCGTKSGWESWLQGKLNAIAEIKKIEQVKRWAEIDSVEGVEVTPQRCTAEPAVLEAYLDYYHSKRVKFQGAFFHRQAGRFRKRFQPLVYLPLPLFGLSVFAVVVHVLIGILAEPEFAKKAEPWTLAFAVLPPVCGLCLRAWLGAFEHLRSAALYEAKSKALETLSEQLNRDRSNFAASMHHIDNVEHFLEQEHREWLRLLLEAEWFF